MRKDISLLAHDDRICFATVRNPYSWLVSYFHHAGALIPESKNPTHYDYKLARKGFKPFVQEIASRDVYWPSRKFIHFALFAYHGELMIDRLVHQENLDEELKELANDYNLVYKKRKRAMVSKGAKDYRTYYDDELIELVEETWSRELCLLGYNFDGRVPSAVLNKKITKYNKKNVKYYWDRDYLDLFSSGLED